MSNFSYDDFAVLVRKFNPEMLSPESLRIVPLSTAPSMAVAIHGTSLEGEGLDSELNLPKQKNGHFVESNVTVQHNSDGYCRLVGHIEAVKPQEGQEGQGVTIAKAFVLYRTVTDATAQAPKKEVIAVASLKEGFAIGDVCYPSFTITTVNNYQSVAFNPNAFATVEDLKNINGLDGLHIAFDTDSGDLKLLDKDGNVLDQANLPIKADVIIADGEEGYKYVKTDVAQDIHAAKAWMPEGKTAWEDVKAVPYTRRHAALVVGQGAQGGSGRSFVPNSSTGESYPISVVTYTIGDLQDGQYTLTRSSGTIGPETITGASWKGVEGQPLIFKTREFAVTGNVVEFLVITYAGNPYLVCVSEDGTYSASALANTDRWDPSVAGTIVESVTSGGSSTGGVVGITPDGINLYTFDENAGTPSKILNISGEEVRWLDRKPLPEVSNYTLKYGLEAFVWTVKDRKVKLDEPFFQQLNNSLLALGFHEGDDIALGTNLANLAPTDGESPLNGVDADEYMHGETKNGSGQTNKELREQEVDEQRKLAKAELVEWNKQHPGLDHDGFSGTRISASGLDVRNGKIEIGNGIPNEGEDSVKRYVIETDIGDPSEGARAGKGLQIGVMGSVQVPEGLKPIQRDILTINAEDYISGAPTCLALLKCSKSGNPATVSASLEGGRITANFTASGMEDASDGAFKLTITDNRANNGFGSDPRIVEIIPVYKSGADASEAVPAQRSISAIAGAEHDKETGKSTLSIHCSQVIDWAQSIDLGGTVASTEGQGNPVPNGMELYLIVKVY